MANPRDTPVKPVKETVYTMFKIPFYLSAITGVIPFSIPGYAKDKIFKASWAGNIWSVLNIINLAVNYHFATVTNMSKDEITKSSKNHFFLS